MSALKQYLLFAGEHYYPSGGWEDFVGDFDTLDEAKAASPTNSDWAHIVEPCSGEVWEHRYAVNNRTYPDWPNLPAGWFNQEELRHREQERSRQVEAYRKKSNAELAARNKAWDDKQKAMVESYRKRSKRD